jgi:hypothetical protein
MKFEYNPRNFFKLFLAFPADCHRSEDACLWYLRNKVSTMCDLVGAFIRSCLSFAFSIFLGTLAGAMLGSFLMVIFAYLVGDSVYIHPFVEFSEYAPNSLVLSYTS